MDDDELTGQTRRRRRSYEQALYESLEGCLTKSFDDVINQQPLDTYDDVVLKKPGGKVDIYPSDNNANKTPQTSDINEENIEATQYATNTANEKEMSIEFAENDMYGGIDIENSSEYTIDDIAFECDSHVSESSTSQGDFLEPDLVNMPERSISDINNKIQSVVDDQDKAAIDSHFLESGTYDDIVGPVSDDEEHAQQNVVDAISQTNQNKVKSLEKKAGKKAMTSSLVEQFENLKSIHTGEQSGNISETSLGVGQSDTDVPTEDDVLVYDDVPDENQNGKISIRQDLTSSRTSAQSNHSYLALIDSQDNQYPLDTGVYQDVSDDDTKYDFEKTDQVSETSYKQEDPENISLNEAYEDDPDPPYFQYDSRAKLFQESDDNVYEPVHIETGVNVSEDEDGSWGSDEFEQYSDQEEYSVQPSTIEEAVPEEVTEQQEEPELNEKRQSTFYENLPAPVQGISNFITRTLSSRQSQKQVKPRRKIHHGFIEVNLNSQRHPPPQLPPAPADLTSQQMKRRYIVSSIVDSEKSYLDSLKRIVKDYEEPLLDNPSLLSTEKVETIFSNVPPIIQSHVMFQIALSDCVVRWDTEQKIGGVFASHFGKDMVFDAYSAYVNNFTTSMDSIKQAAKSKQGFSDFLTNQITKSSDKLSLFGLMVKPVQRFPQFILLLQDLLKNTESDHPDRMDLQVALTVLENLAHKLNERKRNSEQKRAVKEILNNMNVKFVKKGTRDDQYLIRQDVVKQMEYNSQGTMNKSKKRKLFIFNNMMVCVTMYQRDTDTGVDEKYRVKWAIPLSDIELEDSAITPCMQFSVTGRPGHTVISTTRSGSLVPDVEQSSEGKSALKKQLDDVLHDFAVIGQISGLATSLRGTYQGLSEELFDAIKKDIQKSIQHVDEQLRIADSCTLQLLLPENTVTSRKGSIDDGKTKKFKIFGQRGGFVKHYYRLGSASEKQSWVIDFKMTKLAADSKNKPAWFVPETEKGLYSRPMFIRDLPLDITKNYTKIDCAVQVCIPSGDQTGLAIQHLWTCSGTEDNRGQITIVSLHSNRPRVIESFMAVDARIIAAEFVVGSRLSESHVWMGTTDRRVVVHSVLDTKRKDCVFKFKTPGNIQSIRSVQNKVFIALDDGRVAIYRQKSDGHWNVGEPKMVELQASPVTCMVTIGDNIWCCCGSIIYVIDSTLSSIQAEHTMEGSSPIQCMAQTGAGIWVAYKDKALLQLYHIETMKHIQDQNIQSAVIKTFPDAKESTIFVTCMIVTRGLLWIGTNIGIILTLDLPRLDGVPVVTGRPCLSYHAQNGPIKFLMPISCELIPFNVQHVRQSSVCSDLEDSDIHTSEDASDKKSTVSFDVDSLPPVNRSLSAIRDETSGLAASKWKFVSTPNIASSDYDDINSLYSCLMAGDTDYESEFFSSLKGYDGHHTGYMTIQNAKFDDILYRKNVKRNRQRKTQSVGGSFGATNNEQIYEPVQVSKVKPPKPESKKTTSLIEHSNENTMASTPKKGLTRKTKEPSSVIIVSGGNGYYSRAGKETDRERRSEDPRLLMWLTKTD